MRKIIAKILLSSRLANFESDQINTNMEIKVFLLKAFGVDESGGNPAGVVLNAEDLTEEQKKTISREVGFSETAFVEKSDRADFKVTFFTPTNEVDMCGHATIATYSLLFQNGIIKPGNYIQEIKAGELGISVNDGGLVTMEQKLPIFSEFIDAPEIHNVFGKVNFIEGLIPQIVSTGLRDIILPVRNREELFSMRPNYKKMADFNNRTDTIGTHAFTLDVIKQESVANCRNFAPLYGINEESATGSSNGALACYLFKYGKLATGNLTKLQFEQGYSMQKPSQITVYLQTRQGNISKVEVGGKAIMFGEKELNLVD